MENEKYGLLDFNIKYCDFDKSYDIHNSTNKLEKYIDIFDNTKKNMLKYNIKSEYDKRIMENMKHIIKFHLENIKINIKKMENEMANIQNIFDKLVNNCNYEILNYNFNNDNNISKV